MSNTEQVSNDSVDNAALSTLPENTTAELSFEDAFKGFADNFQKTGDSSYSAPSVQSNSEDLDDSSNIPNENANSDNGDVNDPSLEENPADNSADLDYRKLYEKTKRDSDAKLGLLYNRINEMSERYNQLLDTRVQQTPQAKQEPQEMPHAIKELYEVYPDIAEAVTQLIESRLQETTANVESSIERRVAPVQKHLELSAQQQHLQAIMQEHSDLPAIVQSGVLLDWVDSLDPVSRAGAVNIMQNGSSSEVVALVSMFKQQYAGTRNNVTPQNASQKNPKRDDLIAKKVLNALAVDTPRSVAPTTRPIQNAPKTTDYRSDFDSLAKDYEQNVWRAKRF